MPAPAQSSPFERLQATYIRLHNNRVNTLFRDITSGQAETPRGLLRADMLMTDNDTAMMMQLKTALLNDYIDTDRNYYTIPIEDYHRSVALQPQISLTFIEKQSTANSFKRRRVQMRLGLRLVDKTRTTINQTYVNELEREIKATFPKTYSFDKGKVSFNYREREKGLDTKIYAQSETEAKTLITNILKIVDKVPDWDYLTKSEYTDKNLITPKYETILGERTKLPIQRPTATVYLQRAELKIGGLLKDVVLLDRYV
jgi:hypothetical protein